MIPKNIIYGWFGDMKARPEVEEACLKSWEKVFPRNKYNYIRLDESTIYMNCCKYVKSAYQKGLYSFVNDFARVWALYTYGGIYLDTDVFLLKKFPEEVFTQELFFGSCELDGIKESHDEYISWGVVGASKQNKFMYSLLQLFYTLSDDYCKSLTTNDAFIMKATGNMLKALEGRIDCKIYPFDWFTCTFWKSDKLVITNNSCAVHLYGASWTTDEFKSRRMNTIMKLSGELL